MPSVNRRQFVTTVGVLPAGIWMGAREADGQTGSVTDGNGGWRTGQNGADSGGDPDPGSAAALFNRGYSHEATVAVGDREYAIYRYQNYLAADAGVEVFQGADRLTSEERVSPVFNAEGWQGAFATLDPERLEDASDIGKTATSFNDLLRDISGALVTVLDLIRRVQSELGRNLWRVVTDRYPEIEEFRELARRAKTNADRWVDASTRLVDSLSKLRDETDELARAQGRNFHGLEPAFYDRFETRFGRVSSSLESIASVAQQLVDPFEYFADRTREVGEEFEYYLSTVDAPGNIADGGSVREPFDELAALVEGVPEPVRDFTQRVSPLEEYFASVEFDATSHERRRMEAWETRREADMKLRLLSSGATFLGFLALAEHWSIPIDTDDE